MTDKLQSIAVPSVKWSVKAMCSTVLGRTDWTRFKRMASALIREATFIKTREMCFASSEELFARSSRK